MPDDSRQTPGLTLAESRTLIGQAFVRRNEAGPDVVLVLEAAEKVRRDPGATTAGDRPFTLLFQGPAEPRLTQGMHDLDHDGHPFPDLFLVPVAAEAEHAWYEAVFG